MRNTREPTCAAVHVKANRRFSRGFVEVNVNAFFQFGATPRTAAAVFVLALTALGVGCSSKASTTQLSPDGGTASPDGGAIAAVPCDQSKCTKGNQCIKGDDGVEKCRLVCTSQDGCPDGYACAAKDPLSYCVAEAFSPPVTKNAKTWGASCPPGKIDTDACDTAQAFYCYGHGKTDANGFCTRYDCVTDSDCPGGWFCVDQNVLPNVASDAVNADHATVRVCLPREYCAPCQNDVDCMKDRQGRTQHCVADADGGGLCVPECTHDTNCHWDAQCMNFGSYSGCYPRAKRCKGDGTICSPCRSDKDCPNGSCAYAHHSEERFCTVKAKAACDSAKPYDNCDQNSPVPKDGAKYAGKVVCNINKPAPNDKNNLFGEGPDNECIGIVQFGTAPDENNVEQPTPSVGCWTAERK